MVSSGVWAEDIPLERAHNLREVGGGSATMRSELERIGYLGKTTPASYRSSPMTAHFELHIEQGPILEAEKQKIGVVQGVQAYKWYTIDVEGRGELTPPPPPRGQRFMKQFLTLASTQPRIPGRPPSRPARTPSCSPRE